MIDNCFYCIDIAFQKTCEPSDPCTHPTHELQTARTTTTHRKAHLFSHDTELIGRFTQTKLMAHKHCKRTAQTSDETEEDDEDEDELGATSAFNGARADFCLSIVVLCFSRARFMARSDARVALACFCSNVRNLTA